MIGGTRLGAITIAGTRVPLGKPDLQILEHEWTFPIKDNLVYLIDFPGVVGKRMQIALRSVTVNQKKAQVISHQVAVNHPATNY